MNSIRLDEMSEQASEVRSYPSGPNLNHRLSERRRGTKGRWLLRKLGTARKLHRERQVVGDGMAGSVGEISSEPPLGPNGVHALVPKSRPEEVRASVVVMKRVTTVEQRDAGR